jgi:hypothetical protein
MRLFRELLVIWQAMVLLAFERHCVDTIIYHGAGSADLFRWDTVIVDVPTQRHLMLTFLQVESIVCISSLTRRHPLQTRIGLACLWI